MSESEIQTKPIEFEIKPQVTILGPRCSCGHSIATEGRTARRAKAKLTFKRVAHRIRHPFRERQSAKEVMDELREEFEPIREVLENPSKAWGEFSAKYEIDD